jgi:hypothetical protein
MANKVTADPVWDLQVGGLSSDDDVNDAAKTGILSPKGIFAAVPGATPKYAKNTGEQETDFRETMARMFLQVTDYKAFVESFNGSSTQPIATVLGGQASEKTGTTGGAGYIDFLLQTAQHTFQEKAQVVETLTDDHVAYFFGQAAPTFSYGGTLINTKQDDQAMNMLRLYRDIGRGSMLAARNTLISLRYDGLIVSGVMMNLSMSLNAETEVAVPFSFNLLVKKIVLLPQEYGGLVPLQTPFAAASDGYLPFSLGALSVNTAIVRPTMIPSEATVPAASVATEPPPAPDTRSFLSKMREPSWVSSAASAIFQPIL